MPLVLRAAEKLEDDATKLPIATIAGLLQDALGQRMTAYLAGLNDVNRSAATASPAGRHRPRRSSCGCGRAIRSCA